MANDEKRSYTQDQVNAILRRALEQHKDAADGLSHDQLVETAKEVGIDPAALSAAIDADERERGRQELVEKWRSGRKAALTAMWISWAAVNLLTFGINMLAGGPWWFLWVLIPWGLAMVFPSMRLMRAPTQREIDRLQQRELKRGARAQLRDRYRRRADVVERLVDEGAALLLSKLDQRRDRLEGRPERAGLPPSSSSSASPSSTASPSGGDDEATRRRDRERALERDRDR